MSPLVTRPIAANPPGTALARYAKGLHYGVDFARTEFSDTPEVANALSFLQTKATVGGHALATDPSLEKLGIYDAQTALLLASDSGFEAARSRMRELPFSVPVPRQTDGGAGGSWVDEGAPLPAVAWAYDVVKFQPVRCGAVCVFTEDVLRSPAAESVIRNSILGAQGRTESRLFLDPSSGPIGAAPGAITFAATVTVPSASNMLANITTSGKGLAWIGRLPDLALFASIGSAGYSLTSPDLPRSLLGIPAIIAPNSPAYQITLVDFSEIAYAASPLELDLSEQASVEMESAPTNAVLGGSPLAPIPTETVSLFQSDSTAFRCWRFLNWSVCRSGAVVYAILASGSPATP